MPKGYEVSEVHQVIVDLNFCPKLSLAANGQLFGDDGEPQAFLAARCEVREDNPAATSGECTLDNCHHRFHRFVSDRLTKNT